MEKINAPAESSLLLGEQIWRGPGVSELGIYGVIMAREGKVLRNSQAGYLVRTKPADLMEGGVASGYAYLSSLKLTL
jgi:glutathione synthase